MRSQKTQKILLFVFIPVLFLASVFMVLRVQQDIQYKTYLDELGILSFNKYLVEPIGYNSMYRINDWEAYVFTAAQFQCVTGGPYVVLVHRGVEPDKTVLWLEVGDECWPGHPQCGGAAIESEASQFQTLDYLVSGLEFSPFGPASADSQNPVSQWNYVFLPTCDGSWHFGDAAADYDGDGLPDHWHNGLRQTSAAVSLMRQLFPDSQKILVFGSSNGGFGTFGATPLVRLTFPDSHLYVMNDSGPGVFSPDRPEVWPVIQQTWNLAPMFPSDCPKCTQQLAYFFDWMLQRDPKLKVGLFTSYQDLVVSSVLGMEPEEYQSLLINVTGEIHRNNPSSFQRFMVEGRSHCINDYYRAINGVTVWDWLGYLVNDDDHWSELLQ